MNSRRQHEATLDRELTSQKQRLTQEATYELTAALNRLEANLKTNHQVRMCIICDGGGGGVVIA